MAKKGYLILEDKSIYEGVSFGWEVDINGEVVFNTGMVGYPEGFTDPSYQGQILVTTYPLIGNYGVPGHTIYQGLIERFESDHIQIRGLIVSSYIDSNSHWESKETLAQWLVREKIPALSGIDTRSLTKNLREKGTVSGIITFENPQHMSSLVFEDVNTHNLVAQVSPSEITHFGSGKLKVVLFDCGVKFSIIKHLIKVGCTVIRVPWNYPLFDDSQLKFDAIVISNGPGNPKMADKTILATQKAISKRVPILGICLGNQIMALAAGANTYKLKYGHRGQNQPVKDLHSGRCMITTQNHGFAVDTKSLPLGWAPWFENLNDGTNEGIRHTKLPFLSAQFHPEATPGPTDAVWIFEKFVEVVKNWSKQ